MSNNKKLFAPLVQSAFSMMVICLMFSSFNLKAINDEYSDSKFHLSDLDYGTSIATDSLEKEIFKVVDNMPRFSGCEYLDSKEKKMECSRQKMLEFIFDNIEYPIEARDNSVEGTVVVRFIITKDGSLENIEVVRKIGGGCDEESERVVHLMPDWIAGSQKGKAVNVQFNLPIKFKLDKKTLKENAKREKLKNKKG